MAKQGSVWEVLAPLIGIFGTLGVVTLAGRASARTGPPPPKKVALLGDSYAAGLGPELAKLIPNFQYEGRVGTGPASWPAMPGWLIDFAPAVVLVSLGVNDGDNPKLSNYQAVVQALHGIGARVVWIEPPAGVSVPVVRNVIAALGVQTVPATETPLGPDKVHPVSYAPWAAEIAQFVATQVTS